MDTATSNEDTCSTRRWTSIAIASFSVSQSPALVMLALLADHVAGVAGLADMP